MRKKSVFIFLILSILILNLINLNLVLAQENNLPATGLPFDPEKITKYYEQYKTQDWDYLRKEWYEMLQSNENVRKVDAFFKSIDIVFVILFRMHYTMSITLFFVIFFWLYILLKLASILQAWLKPLTSYTLGLAAALVLAWTTLLRIIVNALGKLAFISPKWYITLILIVAVFAGLFIIDRFGSLIKKWLAEKKKKTAEKTTQLAQKATQKWFDRFETTTIIY